MPFSHRGSPGAHNPIKPYKFNIVEISTSDVVHGLSFISGTTTGLTSETGILIGQGKLAGSSTGHVTETGLLVGQGKLSGSSTGHVTETGFLIGEGGLVGESTGRSALSGDLTNSASGAISGSSLGKVTEFGTLKGFGSLLGSIEGFSLGKGTLSGGSSLIQGSVFGHSFVSGVGSVLGKTSSGPVPRQSFGISIANPATLDFKSPGKVNFSQPSINKNSSWPITASPDGSNIWGWRAMPNQLLFLPNWKFLPAVLKASGYVEAPQTAGTSFNVEIRQNYFTPQGAVYTDVIATVSSNILLIPNQTQSWNLTCNVSGYLGIVEAALTFITGGVIYQGTGTSNRFGQFNKVSQPISLSLAFCFQGYLEESDSCNSYLTQLDLM